jgi:hypothetical protein
MKYQSVFKVLLPLIFVLALVAAGMGLFDQAPGHSYALTNFRGEQVTINGRGLYYWDTLSIAVQVMNARLLPLVLGFLVTLAIKALPTEHCLRGS